MVESHTCIDCIREIDETDRTVVRQPRRIVTAEGQPKRCATHEASRVRRTRKQSRARSIERTYGISAEDAYELLLLQGGRCWLCQKATGATKSLAVDHDHTTNEVRGRLCGPCNQFIGRLGDDPAAAERLVAYLTGDTPYRRLRAKQTISAAMLPAAYRPGSEITVHSVIDGGLSGELYANWCYGDGTDPQQWYRTLVRLADGTWTTIRPENVFPQPSLAMVAAKATDAEPRVTTPGECGSCHALPGQPHTDYCELKRQRTVPANGG